MFPDLQIKGCESLSMLYANTIIPYERTQARSAWKQLDTKILNIKLATGFQLQPNPQNVQIDF
jgi:hypothetical protein